MKLHHIWLVLLGVGGFVIPVRANVRVFVQEDRGLARIKYECTGEEVVRAFALNVTVDRGQIIGVSNYFRGPSTTAAKGYGIFPAAFRNHITVNSGTNANWDVAEYTPLAVVTDCPTDTLPGLNSAGVTLEFGALWDPLLPSSIPGPTGTLCVLRISEAANVSVAPNVSRGGVVSASPELIITSEFAGALVDPVPRITGVNLDAGVIAITFRAGELMSAPAADGPWTGTGNSSGVYAEPVAGEGAKFFRVRGL